jgi:hypothetical protein
VDFNVITQLQIKYFALVIYIREEWECNENMLTVNRASDSVRREVLYSLLIKFRMHIRAEWVITICLTNIASKSISRHLSDACPVQNGLKQGSDTIVSSLLFICFSMLC